MDSPVLTVLLLVHTPFLLPPASCLLALDIVLLLDETIFALPSRDLHKSSLDRTLSHHNHHSYSIPPVPTPLPPVSIHY